MRSCLKTLMVGTGILLILIAVLLIVAATQLKTVARSGIEHSLSLAFLTDVTVGEVGVVLHEGHIEIHDVIVGNPASFRTGSAMELDTVIADVDVRTLFSRTPTVDRIIVKGARVDLRHELAEGANLVMLARNASRFSKKDDGEPAGAPPAPSNGPGREFLIKELCCEGATVAMSTNLIPMSGLKVEVAPFTLTDIGKDRPISTPELSAIFVRSLIKQTMSTKGLLRPIADLLQGEGDDADATVTIIEEPEPELAE
jgi:uncharacterized protein involved in outer membrane biogenesis